MTGSSYCRYCQDVRIEPSGISTCSDCPKGSFYNGKETSTGCQLCPIGVTANLAKPSCDLLGQASSPIWRGQASAPTARSESFQTTRIQQPAPPVAQARLQIRRLQLRVRRAARESTTTKQDRLRAISALRASLRRARGCCNVRSVRQGAGYTRRASTTLRLYAATAREDSKESTDSPAPIVLQERSRRWRVWVRAGCAQEASIHLTGCRTAWSVRLTHMPIRRGPRDGSVLNARTESSQRQERHPAPKLRWTSMSLFEQPKSNTCSLTSVDLFF